MNNNTKTRILKFLDILPDKIGYWLYHRLQLITLQDVNFYYKKNRSSFQFIQRLIKDHEIELKGQNVVEIGSGWFPLLPLLFKEALHVDTVYTYVVQN